MTDYNKIAMDNLNALMREIAEYSRMAEEIGETLDSLKDSLKKYMEENGICPKLPHDIPKRQKPGVSCSCEEVQKMGFLFLLVFPFVLLAEILKRN